jgi:hypothetical protein
MVEGILFHSGRLSQGVNPLRRALSFTHTLDAGRAVVAYVVTRDSPAKEEKKKVRKSFFRFAATAAVSN